ncbi:TPA: 30S ribosomal protein S1 [Candidatus Uhrbacteria bacterium]|uniref:RNA binding S1 domain protein n=2 Tax=Candidatus Uhriibacteriota TaxID=1752732 RepID=A0A0G1Q634_9BACT|nr:MAG: RNA binding S1 domain protein [Candidatus Uhrbacteria bacterium GW2011_GWF2_46_218]KKU40516.1 MAG: RNA binding S1 domain protein [Candidatus Uhrbacteria bacterium GW2011_GWE2_46_68]HBK33607.1 30S ribosomal protein S1 [Candidatus Uhrbacteria bacterium]HCB19001.1 30S ribosomal protein S1 [Candidatus Uhrbacteria bacterium]
MTQAKEPSELAKLLEEGSYLQFPQVGDVINGHVVSSSRREVRVDIGGFTTGVVRGRELFAESEEYTHLQPGEEIQATVVDLENENGEMELSFRFAGQKKAWDELKQLFTSGDIVEARVLEANKGGLLIRLQHVTGFLPVSQLSPENYPRVSGGDKNKILEKLRTFVGQNIKVRVIDVNENEDKLIVSEKAVWEDQQKNVIAKYQVGDVVEGEVTAVADFGAFVKFEALEGLVHISEIAWQRIDHPRDVLKTGQHVRAEIIGIEGSKIFLSMKKLLADPWKSVGERYKVGDVVKGKVLKVNPFGFFVELDPEIHGLAHVSELSDKPVADVKTLANPGDILDFKVVSVEPKEHRLGLSLKTTKNPAKKAVDEDAAPKESESVPEAPVEPEITPIETQA